MKNKKLLAIEGHPTQGKEVIELLKMIGGKDTNNFNCSDSNKLYYVSYDYYICWDYIDPDVIDEFEIFTLEKFLEKYPFKVGDKVVYTKFGDNCDDYPVTIESMKWTGTTIEYTFNDCVTCLAKDLKMWNGETDAVISGIYLNSCDYADEVELNLGDYKIEVRDGKTFAVNKKPKYPKTYEECCKVIECGVNKEIVMNENKPLFKTGDVVKLKGCPDKNLFWIVMDVIEDGYIFNDGKKYSFDDQHHYEKSNREVINTQPSKMKNVLAELLDHINNTSKEELEKEFKEIEEWSNVGPTVEEFMDFCNKVNKKPKYPKTYEECCKVFDFCGDYFLTTYQPECMINKEVYGILQQVNSLTQLLICKSAYWKIAGEQMGIGKPWEPNWDDENEYKYGLFRLRNIIYKDSTSIIPTLLIFPTIEMRDAFYDNFKDLIEQCKELL